MKIKEIMLDTESERGKRFYTAMLNWLDSPKRKRYDNPEQIVASSGITTGQTVLEIGCGSGYFTISAAKSIGDSGVLYATDIHSIAIEQTQEKVESHKLQNVVVQKDDALHSEFKNDFFDGILLYGVVPAPVIPLSEIASEMYRLIKPGGFCAIWSKAPFWSPRKAMNKVGFVVQDKNNGVYTFLKPKSKGELS